ncbi:MAG: hypothetical protein ACFFCZ_22710 [Promethearchaeota archaeon]
MEPENKITDEFSPHMQRKLHTISGFDFRPFWMLLLTKVFINSLILLLMWIIFGVIFAEVMLFLGIDRLILYSFLTGLMLFLGCLLLFSSIFQAYNLQLKTLIIPFLDKQAFITQLWIVFDKVSESQSEGLDIFEIAGTRQKIATLTNDQSIFIVGPFYLLKKLQKRFELY